MVITRSGLDTKPEQGNVPPGSPPHAAPPPHVNEQPPSGELTAVAKA